ncbi:ABC transporter permease [Nonomuraea sp. NPDC049421]|uniref:ABC transporter permease n=1 Tax=Nonomuraea sp. NPDC049421 TaxID=3155275 RepID=UPI003428586B
MIAVLLRRLAELLLVLLALSVLVFLLTSLAPGDPAEEILRRGGGQPTAAAVAALRAELGLDEPLSSRYLRWVLDVLGGDLGRSYVDRSPVAAEIAARLPATLLLAVAAAAVSAGLALLVALMAVVRPRALDSRILALVTVAAGGVPPYIVGILLISVVAVGLRLLPTGGPDSVVLPALTLGLAGAATLLRLLRADLARALRRPFVRLAAAKGLRRRRTVVVHALRVAAPNAVTAMSLVVAELLAGAVVVETLFAWPGIGQLAVAAIRQRDVPVVQGYVLVVAVATVLLLAATELCLSALDPRLRGGER